MGSSIVAPPGPSIALHRLPALLFSPFPAFAFCLLAVTPLSERAQLVTRVSTRALPGASWAFPSLPAARRPY